MNIFAWAEKKLNTPGLGRNREKTCYFVIQIREAVYMHMHTHNDNKSPFE